jgi:hypothetical protein
MSWSEPGPALTKLCEDMVSNKSTVITVISLRPLRSKILLRQLSRTISFPKKDPPQTHTHCGVSREGEINVLILHVHIK